MGSNDLELLSKELDEMAIKMLRLMKDYIDVKLNLESLIKAGSLHLAKSRYIMGNKSVSVLQLPSDESSEFTASTRVIQVNDKDSEDFLSFELSKVSLEDVKEADMRFRNNKETQEENTNEGVPPEENNSEKISIPDPLKWFGILVPQNMRQAQSNFAKALEYSIQCANIQIEIEKLKESYKIKISEKNELNAKLS